MKNSDNTERQATQMATSRLAAIVDSSSDAIIGKDLNGIITTWNQGAEEIFGYTAGEIVGTSMRRLIPADRQEEEDYILQKVRLGEKVEHYETLRQTKTGRLVNISVAASPIKDAAGNIIGVSKIARDITELKAHQQEVIRLSRFYAALSQINQAIVWTRHRDELFQRVCRVLVEAGKFSLAWIGMPDSKSQQVHPVAQWGDKTNYLSQVTIYADARPEGQGPMGRAIREGQKYICNDFAHDPDTLPWQEMANRVGYRAAAAFPIRQRGAVCGAVVVYSEEIGIFRDMEISLLEEAATDVSFALDYLAQDEERSQAELAMRESEERYRALFDRSLDCVFLYDFTWGILDANQAALNLLGYRREDIATLNLTSLLTEDQLPLARQVTEEIKTTGHQKHPTEFRLRHKDGRQVYVETRSSLIYQEGKPYAIQGIARDLTERIRALDNLRENEADLREAQRVAKLGNWKYDIPGNQLRWSDELCRIFGIERTQFNGTHETYLNCITPDDRPKVLQVNAEARASGDPFEVEYLIQTQAGDFKTIREIGYAIKDVSGKVVGMFGTAQDISDHKRTEESLFTSEQRLNAFFTSAPAGLVLLDKQLRYVQLNETVAQINAVPMKDHLGKTVREILPKLAPVAEPLLQQVLDTGEPMLNIELSGETPNQPGILRHWMESIFPVLAKDGSTEGVGVIFVEITEHKEAEESLRLLHSAVMQAKDSIVITDAQLDLPGPKIVFVNPAFTQMTGYGAEEVIGKTPRILQGPRTDKSVMSRLRNTLERGEVFDGEAVQYRKDGTEYDQEWQIAPLRDPRGEITHFVAIQRDITAQHQLESQFRHSQKMEAFGQLAGGVAHDFNNILAVIQMQAGLLKLGSNLSLQQLDLAGEIEMAANRGGNLTRQLLLFSRKQTMQPRNLDLTDLVGNIAKMLQRTLGEQFELNYKNPVKPLVIHADPTMMDQVLLNLIVNARDAMPKGGRVFIETQAVEIDDVMTTQLVKARPGSFACVSVSDFGCGIPPENLSLIFEPFFTTKDVGKGTGLGLATVFGIVQQHKGWINVYSEVGHGTTFRVYLPRLTCPSDTDLTLESSASIRGGNDTILLVEDEAPLRRSVRMALSRLGYNILEAATGGEALEVWNQRSGEIRLLLTDMVMPGGMTGKELADQLSQQNPNLKVIYTSGYSAEIAGLDFFLEEGLNFLAKPFQAHKLAQIIRRNLDKST